MQQLLVRTTINYWPRGMELWFIWPFEARFRFQLVSAGNRLCAEYLSGFPRMHALTLCRSINDWIAKRKKRKKNPPCYLATYMYTDAKLRFRTRRTGMHETETLANRMAQTER